MASKNARDQERGLNLKQAEIIIKLQKIVKEMAIANAKMDVPSEKWVSHLAKVAQAECIKLIKPEMSDYVKHTLKAHEAMENG